MSNLNYHHLRYFHAVAHDGNLTRTAERLNLSQSALSSQIKSLEARFGQKLFDRVGRSLELTEVGRIALDHADRIFGTGEELLATLNQSSDRSAPLRVGALSTLSRNFQLSFLKPVLHRGDVNFQLASGNAERLLNMLKSLALDVVLTTQIPARDARADFVAQRISQQPVGLHGIPERLQHPDLMSLLMNEPLIVPNDPVIRAGFDSLVAREGLKPRIVADVDDMAMVRLLARDGVGLAIAPAVVLADEIASGLLMTAPHDLSITEEFYAVTIPRSFPHPLLSTLLKPDQS